MTEGNDGNSFKSEEQIRQEIIEELPRDLEVREKYRNDPRLSIFDKEQLLALIDEHKATIHERDLVLVHGVGGWLPKLEADRLREERDRYKSACAEMRAALVEIIKRGNEQRGTGRMIETAEALLSRTDLGAGMVAVPREVVEATALLVTLLDVAMLARWSPAAAQAFVDLRALLDGGKADG